MINSNMKTYNYYEYEQTLDEYGQETIPSTATGTITMSISNINQTIADNIRYNDATYVGVTFNRSVSDKWIIADSIHRLKVLYVNKDGRYTLVYMAEI